MKRLALFITLSLASAQPMYDELRTHALAFDRYWMVYVEQLFGCPTDRPIQGPQDCHPEAARVDYAAFGRARREAAKVFGFKE